MRITKKTLELDRVARTNGWHDLAERIHYYFKEKSKIYNRIIFKRLDSTNPANLPLFVKLLARSQESDWEDLEDEILHIVRKLEDERDFGPDSTKGGIDYGIKPRDKIVLPLAEHERLLQDHKKSGLDAVFMNFIKREGGDLSLVEENMPIVVGAHKPTAPDFPQRQTAYQNLLTNTFGFSRHEIMDYNQSAGYEFEFASFYDKTKPPPQEEQELMSSHIELAHSSHLGSIFNLPFKLETDSGNSLEMVTPPFLFLISKDSQGILGRVFELYSHASTQLENALSSPTDSDLNTKAAIFAPLGFGSNWQFTGSADNLIAISNAKHKQGPYGQVNISMTANEIVTLLEKLSQVERSESSMSMTRDNTVTTRLVNIFNETLTANYKPAGEINPAMNGAFLLYSRSAANIVAIPSILLRQDYHSYEKKPDPNYATEVKESLGLWVKDNPHKVLLEYLQHNLMTDTRDFITSMIASENQVIRDTLEVLSIRKGEVFQWIKTMKTDQAEARIKQMRIDFKLPEEPSERLPAAKKLLEEIKVIQSSVEIEAQTAFEKWSTAYRETLVKELYAFNQLIRNNKIELGSRADSSTTDFLSEAFGSGMGVRKDTYLGSIKGDSRTVRVAEIRGKKELDIYEA